MPQDYRSGVAEVRAAAQRAERPPDAITPALFVTVLVAEDADAGRAALDQFATETYGFGIDVVEHRGQVFFCVRLRHNEQQPIFIDNR